MLHDPAVYPDPEAFKPERYLANDQDGTFDPAKAVFGFGRR